MNIKKRKYWNKPEVNRLSIKGLTLGGVDKSTTESGKEKSGQPAVS